MKVVLYTCTFVDYDQIFSPLRRTEGVDYVLLSDRRPRLLRGWTWRPLPAETRELPQTLANRYCKFFPHRLFPEADVSIYVDGNTLILGDLAPLIAEFVASQTEIGLFIHKERNDIFAEFELGRRIGKIPAADAERGAEQIARYRAAGLAEDHVFTENGIIFRRHGGAGLDAAMALWWNEITNYTRRDQISLPYVLHATGIPAKVWDWNYRDKNEYFMRYPHKDRLVVNLATILRALMMRGGASYYICGALFYALRGATGDFSRIRLWQGEQA